MTTTYAPSAARSGRPGVAPLPAARGPLSEAVLALLTGRSRTLPAGTGDADPYGEDAQLALHLSYELHYRALAGVDPDLEWDPELLRLRRLLERAFLAALRADVEPDVEPGEDVDEALAPLLREPVHGTGPSWHLWRDGSREQLREYVAHRSVYHLKEADPQAWLVPRLEGSAKAALVQVQHDEYGGGRPERMHAQLFAEAMAELDLDPAYGAYVDAAPAATLAPVTLMSMVGLHRSLRGVGAGQFAMIEITSSPGSRRLAAACARLGTPAGQRFYDEHVEADAVHEQLLRRGLLDGLLAAEPGLAADVVLGVRAGLLLEERFGAHLSACWQQGRPSLAL